MSTQGWAVVDYGTINIKTVSGTRRAAIVNWLVVQKGEFITNAHSDEDIERLWEVKKNQGTSNADVVRVNVEVA